MFLCVLFLFKWSISDYFSQNSSIITTELCKDLTDSEKAKQTLPPFDALWMCVYTRLGTLCVDARPAVRKSAGQTLFTTIAAHGALLQSATWQTVLWQVGRTPGNIFLLYHNYSFV